MVELRAIGALDLRSAGADLRPVLAQPKRAALLVYLALARPRGFQRRDKLLGLFWPELDDAHARAALNQALRFLRRALGANTIVSRGDEVAVNPDQLSTDVATFETLLDGGRADEALALYQGDLLESFHAAASAEFDQWLELERARLRERVRSALVALRDGAEAAGQLPLAIAWARRAVALVNPQEADLRRLLQLLDRSGDRAAAQQAYDDFVKRLQLDLEVEPAPETRALMGAIRARAIPGQMESALFRPSSVLPARMPSRRSAPFAALALIGLAVIMVTFVSTAGKRSAERLPVRFEINFDPGVVPSDGPGHTLTISRDGSQIAFVGEVRETRGIAVGKLDSNDVYIVPGTAGASAPSFSPDGDSLLFTVGRALKKIALTGGRAHQVADTATVETDWGDRGEILYTNTARYRTGGGVELWRVSGSKPPTLLLKPDPARGILGYRYPHILPGGRAAVVTVWKAGGGRTDSAWHLAAVRLKDGRITELGVNGLAPRYAPSGHLLFARSGGTVYAAPFNPQRLRLTGPAVPVLDEVNLKTAGQLELDIADNGTLVYKSRGARARQLVTVDRRGRVTPWLNDQQLFNYPRVSPDGKRIAVTVEGAASNNVFAAQAAHVWIYDFATRTPMRLSRDGNNQRPEWDSDDRVVYVSAGERYPFVRAQPSDGRSNAQRYLQQDGIWEISVGPPGSYIAVQRQKAASEDIFLAPQNEPDAWRPFSASDANERAPRISPDGGLIAYASDESGRFEVYVRSVKAPGQKRQVSAGGALQPVWSPDGNSLFYRSASHLWVAEIKRHPDLAVTRRQQLFVDRFHRGPGSRASYDVMPGGHSLLMLQPIGREYQLTAVVNWTDQLTRRAPPSSR